MSPSPINHLNRVTVIVNNVNNTHNLIVTVVIVKTNLGIRRTVNVIIVKKRPHIKTKLSILRYQTRVQGHLNNLISIDRSRWRLVLV